MKKKAYKKVTVVAKNNPQGSYVAGCPADKTGNEGTPKCKNCERSA